MAKIKADIACRTMHVYISILLYAFWNGYEIVMK